MSYDLMFQKAIELQNEGALNQAEELYLKILQVMPENSDVWNLLGLIAQSKNDLNQALDCFLNAIKYAPTPFFAHFFNLGLTYKALYKPKEAIEAFERAVKLKPDLKEGFNLLGVMYAEQNELKKATQHFCQALDIDNNYEEARANLCYYTKDLLTLFKLSDENKENFMTAFLAAKAAQSSEDKEKYLLRALKADDTRTDALLELGNVYAWQQNFNKALTFYYKVLNLEEKNVWAMLGIADIYLLQKDFDKAESFYLKSFNISKDIAAAHINYATLLYQQKRLTEALEEYRAALQLAPDSPEISYNLALILKETGDIEEALGLMFNAHLKAPDNALFAVNLMESLSEYYEKNAEAALKIADNWQKLKPDNVFSKRILAGLSGSKDEENNVSYAKELFNAFADSYDETMEKLHPQIIERFMKEHGAVQGYVLDLGCGTGIAAERLKTLKNRFDGVDVAENMLKLARAKGQYDNLYCSDIETFLRKHKVKKYDLIVAFDVFCYLGDLREVLKLLKGKEVWFSVEAGDDERGQDYYPTPSGRYKHKRTYIESVLRDSGFKAIRLFELVIRQENGNNVKGFLIKAA